MSHAVPPLLDIQNMHGHLLSGTTPPRGYTLGSGNGALSVRAYSGSFPFGLQLRGPFNPCAVAGSHLTRLSETRLRTY